MAHGKYPTIFPTSKLISYFNNISLWDLSLNKISLDCKCLLYYKYHTTTIYWMLTMFEVKFHKGYSRHGSQSQREITTFTKILTPYYLKQNSKYFSYYWRSLSIWPCLSFLNLFHSPAHSQMELTLPFLCQRFTHDIPTTPFAFYHLFRTPELYCDNPTCAHSWPQIRSPLHEGFCTLNQPQCFLISSSVLSGTLSFAHRNFFIKGG